MNCKRFFSVLMVVFCLNVFASNDSIKGVKTTEIFGTIFPSFSAKYSKLQKTWYGFDMNSAQVGFKTKINKKINTVLLYNVTKTTGEIFVRDTSNNMLQTSYFKGSDFTAFLKQAELIYTPSSKFEISIGQIFNQQYMTVQDIFWGYRYVISTMQEVYKFGHQADFGFKISYILEKLSFSAMISNGEGPFYKQDKNGLLQYAANIEYRPIKSIILKWYSNVYPNENKYRWTHNFFVGFKTKKFRIGAEGTTIFNDNWLTGSNYFGISIFNAYDINNVWSVFLREDYIFKNSVVKNFSHSILGVQYKIDENFLVSINQRLQIDKNDFLWQTYLSIGYKF